MQVRKFAEIEDSERGATQYLQLMAGIAYSNFDKWFWAKNIAYTMSFYYFSNIWLDTIFEYQPEPRGKEIIKGVRTQDVEIVKSPNVLWAEYIQTGRMRGDCEDIAIFISVVLREYEKINIIAQNEIYLAQIINFGMNEKHVSAFTREEGKTLYSIIDPTIKEIDPSRIKKIINIKTKEIREF